MVAGGVVVVAGASAGVGRAVAARFGRAGWRVALIARGATGLESARREIEAYGGVALAVEADVADAAAIDGAADRVEVELGPIDVWVNNAMVTVYARSIDVTPDEYLQVTRITYLGQVHGTLAAMKRMQARDRGTIVYVGSALAYRSIPFQAPYCAAKSAVRGFVDSLRSELEWERSRVRLSMVHLPAVNTPQFLWARNKLGRRLSPLPPIYQPEVIGEAVFRAARTAPREVWLGTSTLKAIVGQMLAPSIADRYLARGGLEGETMEARDDPGRSDNLFGAGPGDPGARGPFDARSRNRTFAFNPGLLRGAAAIAAVSLTGFALLAIFRPRHQDLPERVEGLQAEARILMSRERHQ